MGLNHKTNLVKTLLSYIMASRIVQIDPKFFEFDVDMESAETVAKKKFI